MSIDYGSYSGWTARDLLNGKGDRAAQTMLDEGINVTRDGIKELAKRISATSGEADALIAGASGNINKADVADRLRPIMAEFQKQVNPNADVAEWLARDDPAWGSRP